MGKKMRANILLMITAIIWGSAFIAQKSGMDLVEPFTFNGIRTLIGSLFLVPVIIIMNRGKTPLFSAERKAENKTTLIGGICCGLALFAACMLQQFGIVYTTAGKAGFITTLYVAFVPIYSLFLRKRVRPIMWLCVVLGVVGLYLLCMTDKSFTLSKGDFLVFLCAAAFGVHILVIDHFSPMVDGVKLSCVQFFVSGMVSIILMFIFEEPVLEYIIDCAIPILYAGVLSSGVAYTLQVVAQKDAEPTAASLILSLESVFAVIFGALILNEHMSLREISGCAVIFIAIIISNLPEKTAKLSDRQ